MSAAPGSDPIRISRTAFTAAFLDFEKQLPVETYTYRGAVIWPLVRRHVMYDFFRAQHDQDLDVKTAANQSSAKTQSTFSFQPDTSKQQYQQAISELANKHTGKVLFFFSSTQKPSDTINGKGYFRHIDPYFERLSQDYDTLRVQITGCNSIVMPTLEHPVHVINSGNLVMNEMRNSGRLRKLGLQASLTNVKQADKAIVDKLKQLDVGYELASGSITAFAERVFAWEKLLVPFIEKLKPRAVFMPCYFCDQQTLGLVAACRRAGVPVIDIQHGGQDNPMYYGWNGVVAESPYLADYFWMWSDYYTSFLTANNSGNGGRAFTGGNYWMRKSLGDIPVTDEVRALRSHLSNYKRVVAVSLQRGLPDHLLAVMKKAPADWYWLLRFHPAQSEVERELIRKSVKDFVNVETERPSRINLYHLLQSVDVHTTGWSTVAIEALQLGVPTIFTHINAEAGFARLIDSNVFQLKTDADGLWESLSAAHKLSEGMMLNVDSIIQFPDQLLKKL